MCIVKIEINGYYVYKYGIYVSVCLYVSMCIGVYVCFITGITRDLLTDRNNLKRSWFRLNVIKYYKNYAV